MHKRIVIGLIVLIFVLGVAIVFYHQYTDIQQYKQELAEAEELEKDLNQQPAADNKPPGEAKEGFEWEWHGDHWHEMPIAQSNMPQQTSIVADDVSKTEAVQVESVVIDSVGDLKEWLSFFESFGDDPTLEELYEREYTQKSIQYGEAMRSFDYKNMSSEVAKLVKQISEKRTSVGYVFGRKFDASWSEYKASQRANPPQRFLRGPIAEDPINDEGGDE